MTLLFCLLLSILFYVSMADQIKKRPILFYIAITLITGFIIYYYQVKLFDLTPKWITRYLVGPFKRGMFSTVTFMIVMFIGVLPKSNPYVKKLFTIRTEMSIIACISTFGHNIVYGIKYFPMLLLTPSELEPTRLIAVLLTLVLLCMLIPLFITSIPSVRAKMSPAKWKSVQRLAIPFFYLIFVHVMVLYSTKLPKKWFDVVLYCLIFGTYFVLRMKKKKEKASIRG